MWAFDIETEHWDSFVLGGCLSDSREWVCMDWRREQDFAEYLLSLEGEIWSHNGGRYDLLWLCDWIRKLKLKAQVFATSARITLLKVAKAQFRDSAALAPLPLETAARIGGYEKKDTGLSCTRNPKLCDWFARWRIPCKDGYCAIHRRMSADKLRTLETYLRGDCEAALFGVVKALHTFADGHKLKLGGTIGSSSWRTAKADLSLEDAAWNPPRLYSFARQAYYGGRVQVFRPYSRQGNRWDINSAYIAALTQVELPTGSMHEVSGRQAKASFSEGKEGIFSVRVDIPKQHIPPLPYHDSKERVWYPYGQCWGFWTGIELRYALANCGVSALEFSNCIVWDTHSPVLASWAQGVWDLRHTAGKSTALGKWLKWFGNSLTGKLAQKPETDVCAIMPDNPPACTGSFICGGVLCGITGQCCQHLCTGACGTMKPLGRGSGVWFREVWRLPSNAYVHWAAYLTAQARIMLHRQLTSDSRGGLTATYCDTDSCYAEKDTAINVGDELGQFMHEGTYRAFRALAPKTYSFIDGNGTRIIKAKGVPAPDWADILDGQEQIVNSGVRQFRSAVRESGRRGTPVFQRRNLRRTVRLDRFGDRLLYPGDDVTKPVSFEAINHGK